MLVAIPALVRAQPFVAVEANGLVPIVNAASSPQPQLDLFGLGGSLSGTLLIAPVRSLLIGARLRGGLLLDGEAPLDRGRSDPGIGSFATLSGLVRLHPLAGAGTGERSRGPFVELGAGGALTGDLVRTQLELGMGYGLTLGRLRLAPTVRYVQIVQPGSNFDTRDGRLLVLGVELLALDVRRDLLQPTSASSVDLDGDGIVDSEDLCPLEPEDLDGFQDEDGCPDPDNDNDGIADIKSRCPLEPEDLDGFQDDDGCLDPDNDADGIADAQDACPNRAEVINGIDDQDGCPDQGVIQMIDDRIVLDERVLFDFSRARVKRVARPIVEAIAGLVRQHAEWRRMRIEGHTDIRGSDEFNMWLSTRRAHNVRKALIEHGIDGELLEAVGFGRSQLTDTGRYPDAHQRNRRVEFVVVTRHPSVHPSVQPSMQPSMPPTAELAAQARTGERTEAREAQALSDRSKPRLP